MIDAPAAAMLKILDEPPRLSETSRLGYGSWTDAGTRLMDLPKTTEQQEAERRSYAILRYKLEEQIGIFRNQTDSDYGIDFEIELKLAGRVTGRSIKAQVKSSKDLKPRKDGKVTVGGIKQATLAYWCSISQQTNVIAYAIDLASEIIYVAPHVFWQASGLLDGDTPSKSLVFVQNDTHHDEVAIVLTKLAFLQPTISALTSAHRTALRGLKNYLELFEGSYHYDAGSPLHTPDHFAELLEVCGTLLWLQADDLWPDQRDRRNWTKLEYWDQKAMEDSWGELCYLSIQPVVTKLMKALIKEMRRLRRLVLAGKYYWAHTDRAYLKRVYETALPADTTRAVLQDWSYHFDSYQQTGMGDYFVASAAKPAQKAPKKGANGVEVKRKK